jgi:hypothetical protein
MSCTGRGAIENYFLTGKLKCFPLELNLSIRLTRRTRVERKLDSGWTERSSQNPKFYKVWGVYGDKATPDPISNSEVKLVSGNTSTEEARR